VGAHRGWPIPLRSSVSDLPCPHPASALPNLPSARPRSSRTSDAHHRAEATWRSFNAPCPARAQRAQALVVSCRRMRTIAIVCHTLEIPSASVRLHARRDLRRIRNRLPSGAGQDRLLPLPASSPETNRVAIVRELLDVKFPSQCVRDTYEAILDGCQSAWNKLMQMPEYI
jgi:hypothetical protein